MKCKICDRIFNALKESEVQVFSKHLRFAHNLNFKEYLVRYDNFIFPKCKCGKDVKWKRGLELRKTCGDKKCLLQIAHSRTHSKETKNILRFKRIKYMQENPEKTSYVYRQRKFPAKSKLEKIFENELKNNNICDYKYDYPLNIYKLDYAFINNKICVEIDGSQHKRYVQMQRDILKDKFIL